VGRILAKEVLVVEEVLKVEAGVDEDGKVQVSMVFAAAVDLFNLGKQLVEGIQRSSGRLHHASV
jgi:hypothetical protein